jgi:hypothetical protein
MKIVSDITVAEHLALSTMRVEPTHWLERPPPALSDTRRAVESGWWAASEMLAAQGESKLAS